MFEIVQNLNYSVCPAHLIYEESGAVPGPGLFFVSLEFVVLLPRRSGGARVPALLWPVVLKAPYIPGACAWLSLSFAAVPSVDSTTSESCETDGGFQDA